MLRFHFPVTLAKLLERREFSQRELARRMDISASNLTQIMDGQRCTPEVLASCCQNAAETEADRYALICAHLRDEVVRCEADPSHVVIRHVEGADLQVLDLTPEVNAYIGTIARAAETDRDVAAIVEGIAGVLVHKAAAEADLAAKLIPYPPSKDGNAGAPETKPAAGAFDQGMQKRLAEAAAKKRDHPGTPPPTRGKSSPSAKR